MKIKEKDEERRKDRRRNLRRVCVFGFRWLGKKKIKEKNILLFPLFGLHKEEK